MNRPPSSGGATGRTIDNELRPDRARPGEAAGRSTVRGDVPARLLERYLIERDRQGRPRDFYRDHRAPEPAFRDHGRRLSTPHAYPDTIADMLTVARHRGWTRLRVDGDEGFRRDVWIQARALGLDVSGYRPRERDRQAAGEVALPAPPRRGPNERLGMASAVIRAFVPDPDVQRRLLVRAAELVAGRLDRSDYRKDREKSH